MKQLPDEEETICAIATPPGEGGIGIVRVSGKDAFSIVAPLYRGKEAWSAFSSHTAHYGEVVDPGDETVIDEVLFLVMNGPNSYTGEDVVEIQGHGNPFLLQKIIALLLSQGARLAAPGEFTRRAFLSGRIDLSQAEAVMEIISAKSSTQHQWALSQLKGQLSKKIVSLRERLVSIIAQIEADIDFSEEGLPLASNKEICEEVEVVLSSVQALLADYGLGRQIRDGFTVVIVGRPNVGKSSLMNALLQEDRAIVNPHPGTTRDILQEPIQFNGFSVKLVDTAGYRKTGLPIEQEGIARAEAAESAGDLTLWVLDSSERLTEEDLYFANRLRKETTIVLFNKIDLPNRLNRSTILEEYTYQWMIPISMKSGEGLSDLQSKVGEMLSSRDQKEPPLVALLRHRNALVSAESGLKATVAALNLGLSSEFPAIDLRESLDSLGEITGETVLDDILEKIFNQFCIGK